MNNLKTGLLREYWEYKHVLLWVPAVLSVLLFLAAMMATFYAEHLQEWALEQADHVVEATQEQEQESEAQAGDSGDADGDVAASKNIDTQEALAQSQKSPREFVSIFLGVAWFVGLYYLLSTLYVDRRDSSILYWKSMPVSETQNVFIKLLFGSLAFVLVALLASWVSYLLLELFGFGVVSDDEGESWRVAQRGFDVVQLFIWPLHGIAAGLLWGAPVFAYLLFISACAKRSRLLLLIGPLVVITVLETIFLRSSVIVSFLTSHMPFTALEWMNDSDTVSAFWNKVFQPSLLLGLLLSALFLYAAIWCRNHRFEV